MKFLIRALLCLLLLAPLALATPNAAPPVAAFYAPTVTAIAPASGSISGNEFVTITGTGFVATPSVTIGGVSCTSVVFISSTSLTCVTGAHAAAVVDVVVTNPDTTFGTLAASFTYRNVPPVCLITGTAFNPDNSVAVNQLFTLSRILLSGRLIAQGPFRYITDSTGQLFNAVPSGNTYIPGSTKGIIVQQGAAASLYSTIPPWNTSTLAGVVIVVPSSPTADLGSLATIAAVPVAGITVQNGGVNLPSKEGTLNAGTGLVAVETTPGTVQISLGGAAGLAPFGGVSTSLQTAIEVLPFGVSAGNTGEFRLYELAANGSNYVGFKAPDNIANNVIWTPPATVCASGQAWIDNGSGVFSCGSISSTWNSQLNPTGNLSLAMGTNTSTFTTSGNTGASAVHDYTDSNPNSGTGPLFRIRTAVGSSALPLQIFAQGTANGSHVDVNGIWRADGAGGFDAAGIITGALPPARLSGSYTGIVGTGALAAGSLTTGFTPVPTAIGGLGANEGGASGILSLNAGVIINNPVTINGVPYGASGNVISFASAAGNNNLFGSSGAGVPGWVTLGPSLSLVSNVADAIQDIRTTSTSFSVQAAGFGVAAPTIGGGISVIGPTLNTQGNSIQAAEFGGLINPSTNANATYNVVMVDPTLNATGASAGRTVNLISTNPTVTGAVGLTVNLLNLNYQGNKANIDSTGAMSLATSLAIGGATPLATTNQSGTGSLAMTVNTILQTPSITGAINFPANVRQTFQPGATNAGLNVGVVAVDPSNPSDGDIWGNSASGAFKGRIGGSVISFPSAANVVLNNQATIQAGTAGSVTGSIALAGSTSGVFTQTVPNAVTSYSIKWPATQGGAGSVPQNDGSGNLSWATGASAAAGGSNTQFQYNNVGALGGTVGLTWNATNQSTIHSGAAISGGATLDQWSPGAHTAVISNTIDHWWPAHTMTVTTGYALQQHALFAPPNDQSATGQTITDDCTVCIGGAPIPGGAGPLAITRPEALLVSDGMVRFATPSGPLVTWDPYATDADGLPIGSAGGAPLRLEPVFTDTPHVRVVGLMIRPTFGSMVTTSLAKTAYNAALGNSATPIPAGTKGYFSDYEANLNSNQNVADASEPDHSFGATMAIHGTLGGRGLVTVQTVDTAASSHAVGVISNIVQNIAVDTANFTEAGSWNFQGWSGGSTPITGILRAVPISGGQAVHGVDMSPMTFTSDQYKGTAFLVDPSGNITGSSLKFNTTGGSATGYSLVGSTSNQGVTFNTNNNSVSTESSDFIYNAPTLNFTAGVISQRFWRIGQPTITGSSSLINTSNATFDIVGPPIAGANMTFAQNYAFRIESALALNQVGAIIGIGPLSANTNGGGAISNGVLWAQGADGQSANVTLDEYGAGTVFRGRRGDNTSGSPSALLSGENILQIIANGFGTSFSATGDAAIRFTTYENFSASAHGTQVGVFTTPATTTSLTEALRIHANGGMQVNIVQAAPVAADFINSSSSSVVIYMSKAVAGRIVFAVNNGGTIEYLYSKVDGSTTTWTAQTGGTAP
jgi:hypothetical protein